MSVCHCLRRTEIVPSRDFALLAIKKWRAVGGKQCRDVEYRPSVRREQWHTLKTAIERLACGSPSIYLGRFSASCPARCAAS